MQTIYKVFLGIFIVFGGLNIFAINYNESFTSEENSIYFISIVASLFGILCTYILHIWSQLKAKKKSDFSE